MASPTRTLPAPTTSARTSAISPTGLLYEVSLRGPRVALPRVRRRIFFLVVFVAIGWAVVAVALAALAAQEALSAQARVTAVRHSVASGRSDREWIAHELAIARTRFESARSVARFPALALLRPVPLLGRQLQSFDALAKSGERVTDIVEDRKSTRLNSSHSSISYAVFCL